MPLFSVTEYVKTAEFCKTSISQKLKTRLDQWTVGSKQSTMRKETFFNVIRRFSLYETVLIRQERDSLSCFVTQSFTR